MNGYAKFDDWMCMQSKKLDGPDYSRFTVSDASREVSTRPLEAKQILGVIDSVLLKCAKGENQVTVFDANGHIGTDTVNFALHWKDAAIHVYETDPAVFKLLEANVREFKLASRVTCHNQSSVGAISRLSTAKAAHCPYSFMYFDPPWGGKVYKQHDGIQLIMDGRPVEQVIDCALDTGLTKFVFLKAPLNWTGSVNLRHAHEKHTVTKIQRRRRVPSFSLYVISS